MCSLRGNSRRNRKYMQLRPILSAMRRNKFGAMLIADADGSHARVSIAIP